MHLINMLSLFFESWSFCQNVSKCAYQQFFCNRGNRVQQCQCSLNCKGARQAVCKITFFFFLKANFNFNTVFGK